MTAMELVPLSLSREEESERCGSKIILVEILLTERQFLFELHESGITIFINKRLVCISVRDMRFKRIMKLSMDNHTVNMNCHVSSMFQMNK
jgi:hypothetical protein